MIEVAPGWVCLLAVLIPAGIVLQYWIIRWAVRHGTTDAARQQRLATITGEAANRRQNTRLAAEAALKGVPRNDGGDGENAIAD